MYCHVQWQLRCYRQCQHKARRIQSNPEWSEYTQECIHFSIGFSFVIETLVSFYFLCHRMEHHDWSRGRSRGHWQYEDEGEKILTALYYLHNNWKENFSLTRTSIHCVLSLSEVQPVYVGVPVSHRRKRRRHHSYANAPEREMRHSHYDHHAHHEQSRRGYYHEREEHYEDDEGSAGSHEPDLMGWFTLLPFTIACPFWGLNQSESAHTDQIWLLEVNKCKQWLKVWINQNIQKYSYLLHQSILFDVPLLTLF